MKSDVTEADFCDSFMELHYLFDNRNCQENSHHREQYLIPFEEA